MAEVKMPINNTSEPKPDKVDKVVKGDIVKRKQNPSIVGEFVKEEPSYVKDYILGEVILPAIKNLIDDIICNGTHMLLFGEARSRSGSNDRGRYATRGSGTYRRDDDEPRCRPRNRYDDFSDIVMTSRADAVAVLNDMKDYIEDYGAVSVSIFYQLVGEDSQSIDNNWGWSNLDRAYVDSVRGGYIIEFPRARRLD